MQFELEPNVVVPPPNKPVTTAPFKNFMAFAWSDDTVCIEHDYLGRFENLGSACEAIAAARTQTGAIYDISADIWTEVSGS